MPEFKQYAATPEALADAVEKLFTRPERARARRSRRWTNSRSRLGEGEEAPSLRAARVLLDFIG